MTRHIDRRDALKCMAWAGTGVLWTLGGGIPRSFALDAIAAGKPHLAADTSVSFVQISDSHIGFNKPANTDVAATLRECIAKIRSFPSTPAFMIHTGDITHLSRPDQFDTADQIIREAAMPQTFFVPGEHDVIGDDGKLYLERYGKGTKGSGWYSFDYSGIHFVGLVNVVNLKAGGLGNLGNAQLEWLEDDLKDKSNSTPIVVFAHMPLWTIYPKWGWGTDDSARALGYLRRFGSVTVLNGHIHQIMQKVEGNVTFHTAMSTAFPQPKPGAAPSPGPMTVPSDRLRSVLGVTRIRGESGNGPLAVIDTRLATAT